MNRFLGVLAFGIFITLVVVAYELHGLNARLDAGAAAVSRSAAGPGQAFDVPTTAETELERREERVRRIEEAVDRSEYVLNRLSGAIPAPSPTPESTRPADRRPSPSKSDSPR